MCSRGNVAASEEYMNNLKAIRRMAAFTQYRLAVRSGVSRTRLSLAESGDVQLTSEERRRIGEILFQELHRQAATINQALAQNREEYVRA